MGEETDVTGVPAFLEKCKEEWRKLEEEQRRDYVTRAHQKFGKKPGFNRERIVRIAFTAFAKDYKEETEGTEYQDGAEGCIRWIEEFVRFKHRDGHRVLWIRPADLPADEDEYGRSMRKAWEIQKEEIRKLLVRTPEGIMKHRLGVFCWPRGEGKSFIVLLIALWRFFNFPFHKVLLSGSSKDQSDNSLLGEMVQTIQNSPDLHAIVGDKGIANGEIRITKGRKGRFSLIKQMSTHSGVMSNVNTVIQTEAFEMATDDYFTAWFGSLRGTPEALGMIDTTVSYRGHWLDRLYESAQKEPDGEIYFSYRYSTEADPADYINPRNTARQLATYRNTFTPFDFGRFFLNRWDAADGGVFSEEDVRCFYYYGMDGIVGRHTDVRALVRKTVTQEKHSEHLNEAFKRGDNQENLFQNSCLRQGELESRCLDIRDVLDLGGVVGPDGHGIRTTGRLVELGHIQRLSDIFDTHWSLGIGIDLADALKAKENHRTSARSVVAWMLKGLKGSRGMSLTQRTHADSADYLYVLIGMAVVENNDTATVQRLIWQIHTTLGGVDIVGGENYAMGPVVSFCKQKSIPVKHWYPNLERQALGFNEWVLASQAGRFIAPDIPLKGSRTEDLFREEARKMDKTLKGKYPQYVSPEKTKRNGIQDDAVYSVMNGILGMMELTAVQFRERVMVMDDSMYGGVYDGLPLVQDFLQL